MSVYTSAQPQIGQQQMQQPYGFGHPFGQSFPLAQMPFQGVAPQPVDMQVGLPYGYPQLGQQPFGRPQGIAVERIIPQLVTELALRCATTALSATVEQLRLDPQALLGIQAQGQFAPHVYSNVLTETARRVAPVLHMAILPILQSHLGQAPGPWFGQQPWAMGQMGSSSMTSGFGI